VNRNYVTKTKNERQFGNFWQNKHVSESCMRWTLLCCSEASHNSKSLRKKRLSLKLSKCDMIICMFDEVYRCTLSKLFRFSRVRWSIT